MAHAAAHVARLGVAGGNHLLDHVVDGVGVRGGRVGRGGGGSPLLPTGAHPTRLINWVRVAVAHWIAPLSLLLAHQTNPSMKR